MWHFPLLLSKEPWQNNTVNLALRFRISACYVSCFKEANTVPSLRFDTDFPSRRIEPAICKMS